MKPLILVALLFIAIPAYAVNQQPAVKQSCQTCQDCSCDALGCRCPQVVTLANGMRVVVVPRPLDTKPGWPYQGPFRWTGAAGRWVVGAPPRFVW